MIGKVITAVLRGLQLQKLWNSAFVQRYVIVAEVWYRSQSKHVKYAVGAAVLLAAAAVLFA